MSSPRLPTDAGLVSLGAGERAELVMRQIAGLAFLRSELAAAVRALERLDDQLFWQGPKTTPRVRCLAQRALTLRSDLQSVVDQTNAQIDDLIAGRCR